MQTPKSKTAAQYRKTLETQKSESTLQLLFRAARLVDEVARSRLSKRRGSLPLKRSHTALLPHIDLEGTRITDLADRQGVTKQAISQLVDELESAGLLARVPDPSDGRARLVQFTDLGREWMLDGLLELQALQRDLAAEIGVRSMQDLHNVLLKLLAVVDEAPPPKDAQTNG